MSDCLKRNIDYLDERTHLIINGYVRIKVPSITIPSDMIHLIILFIDDHFMLTRGTYEWIIDYETLQQMKKAKAEQEFSSPKFKIAELYWMIDSYPNGNDESDAGSFDIFLKILSMPTKWSDIILCYNIRCNETLSSCITTKSFDASGGNWGWGTNTMQFNEIQSLNKLSFTISIIINKITLNHQNKLYYQRNVSIPEITRIEWRINDDLLSKMKQSHNGKQFTSPIHENIFCLYLCPNGYNSWDEGWTDIQLILCTLPPIDSMPHDPSEINLKWKIKLEAKISSSGDELEDSSFNIERECEDDFDEDNYAKHWGSKVLSFENFKKLKDVTICAEIIDNTEKEDHVISTWDQFVERESIEHNVAKCQQRLDYIESTLKLLTSQVDKLSSIQSKHNDNIQNEDKDKIIFKWLNEIVKLPQYYDILLQNGFDNIEFIKDITKEDLKDIGIAKLGHQKRILKCINELG